MWNINTIVSLTVNGVAMGMVYALMAMGLILLIRAVNVMNFAQGDLLMIGAYVFASFVLDFKLPLIAVIILGIVSLCVLGIIFMISVYWPLRTASYPAATVISTIGASIALKEIATLVWGSMPRALAPLLKNDQGKALVLKIGSVRLQWQFILTIIVGIVLIALVTILFEKLYAGRVMQAAAQDKYAAELLGIPTFITTAATYMIVTTLAGVAGYMVAPMFMVSNTLGTLQLRAFAGVVIGGFGSIKGAVIGSVIIGLVEAFSTVSFSEYKDAVVFLVLIVMLLVRPQGLFGSQVADKA